MTDRLQSCKDSPNGRHVPAVLDDRHGVTCAYCDRTLNPRSKMVEEFWQDIGRPIDPDAHLGAVGGE